MADELTNKFQDILEVKADPEAFRKSLEALTNVYETWVTGLKGKAENVLAGGLFGKITQVSQQMQALAEMFASTSAAAAQRAANSTRKAAKEAGDAIQETTEKVAAFKEQMASNKVTENILNTKGDYRLAEESEKAAIEAQRANHKLTSNWASQCAELQKRLDREVANAKDKLDTYLFNVRLRSIQKAAYEERKSDRETARQKNQQDTYSIKVQLQAIKDNNKRVRPGEEMDATVNQAWREYQAHLDRVRTKTEQLNAANQNMLDKFMGGMKGSIVHLIRFNVLQTIISNAMQGLFASFALPFKLLDSGAKYLQDLEVKITDLQGVIASTSNFGGTYAENFKKSGEVAKDVIQEIQDRALRLNVTADQITNTFRELLEAGAGKGVKNMREMVDLAQMFASALKATSGGSLSDKWTISEITKLFNGDVAPDNKLLKTLNMNNKEWKALREEGEKYKNLVELLAPKFKPFLDATQLAELNQRVLIEKLELFKNRLAGLLAEDTYQKITNVLSKIIKYLMDNENVIKATIKTIGESLAIALSPLEGVPNKVDTINSKMKETAVTSFKLAGLWKAIAGSMAASRAFGNAEERKSGLADAIIGMQMVYDAESIIRKRYADATKADQSGKKGGASLNSPFDSKVPKVNLESGLTAPKNEWEQEQEKFNRAVEEVREKYKQLKDATQELLAARQISYSEAAKRTASYVDSEKTELDGLVAKLDNVRAKIVKSMLGSSGKETAEQQRTSANAVNSSYERTKDSIKKQEDALNREVASSRKRAVSESVNVDKEHYTLRLKLQEQFLKQELSLVSDEQQQGYLTSVEAFDKQVRLEKELHENQMKTFASRADEVKNFPEEYAKVVSDATLAEDEYNAKVKANAGRRVEVVLAEEKALRDYASSMRDAAISAQELAISVQEVVNPLASMTKAYDDLYNSRRMALDLQERDLMLELQIAQARNASTDETRKLTTQIANLRNNRLSLYREQMSRASSLAGTGLGTQTLAMRYTNDEAISTTSDRLQREIGEQSQHESKMLSQGFVTPGDIEIWATLQDNVKKTSEELEGLLNVGDELKSSWSNITEDFVGAFFGPEFSALWQKASDAGDSLGKVGLTAEGAAKGLQTVQGLVNAYQSGASQGGVLGGIGGVLNTGILGQVFKSTPVVGQIASVVGSAFSIVGGLFTRSAKKIAAEIKESFQDTVKAYQNGDATLIATLDSLKKQRDSAIRRLSGKKGGDKELENILEQFDDEISDLEKEQKQILENFDSTLEGLQLHSEALDNVRKQWKEVTDQVKEYIGAGGDATKAATLLSLTLRDMKEGYLESLNDGEQEAIQLAIDLNDKLQERIDLTKEFKKNEFDLINADAVERRQAGSVTRGQQLKELREEYEKNLKNVNDEIALGKKKLDMYKDVYSLSTDIEDLHRRDEKLTLEALDKEIQKLKDIKSIADSITLGADGAWSSSSPLLQPASIAITVNVEGSGSAEETGQIIGDSIADELSRQYRMVPAV